ncbi:hypothetical protein LCGC14_2823620, partial [marine sediment metagenome]
AFNQEKIYSGFIYYFRIFYFTDNFDLFF